MRARDGGKREPSARPFLAAAAAVLAVALVVRVARLTEGLPAFLDEAQPLRQALKMWRAENVVDWNPHFFVYPSLAIYFHLALQWIQIGMGKALGAWGSVADYLLAFETDPTPHALLARGAVTAVDLVTLLGTLVLGERLMRGAGIAAGSVVALSPTGIETSRALYVEAVLAAFTIWALERMVVYMRRGTRGPLAAAGALVGLAAATKYPGALLAIPLVWAAIGTRGSPARRLAFAAGALAIAAAAFALASPFVLLDWQAASKDLRFAGALAQHGHLGHLGQGAAGFYVSQLVRDPGVLILALFASLPLVVRDAGAWRVALLLVLAAVPVVVAVAVSSVIAPRYLVPIIPVLAVGAAWAGFHVASAVPAPWDHRGPALAGMIVVASVLPAAVPALLRPTGDTRLEALAWCSRSLPRHALVILESGGPPLLSESRQREVVASAVFRDAAPEARARYQSRAAFNDVAWPLFVHGDLPADLASPGEPERWVQVFPEAVDLNAAFYDLRLLGAADYVITSSIVRSRYEADPKRFASEVAAYRALDGEAEPVARFEPDRQDVGPDIRIYRIRPVVREGWRARSGTLDPGWWLSLVPQDAAIRREVAPEAPSLPDGRPAWASLLGEFEDRHIAPTLSRLATGLSSAGRADEAEPLARANEAWR